MTPPTSEDCRDDQQRRLRRSLNFLCDRLADDDQHSEINNLQRKGTDTNAVTFESIKSKIDGLQYGSTKEFLDDILSMQPKRDFGCSSRLRKIAKKMVEFCKNEISFIDACDSCYELANTNDSSWFRTTCEERHALVWAKVIGYPYEPAKLLSIQDKIATVHFFGDHTISKVQTKLCYRFSEESPNQSYVSNSNVIQEVQEYIKNLGSSFEYAQLGQRLLTDLTPAKTSTKVSGSAHFPETPNAIVTPATKSTCASTIRQSIINLLDKHEEELVTLKKNFELSRSKIEELEKKLEAQKRRFDEDLREAKSMKYCDCCQSSTETAIKIFCSNACGAKWYIDKTK